MAPPPSRFSANASGSNAKLPVPSSSPSRTIITNPTGKTSAPTSAMPVCPVAMKARLVAYPSSAPERNPRMSKSRAPSAPLTAPALTMALTTSTGLM